VTRGPTAHATPPPWGPRIDIAGTALIVIDMLNPDDHEDADELAANVEGIVELG
jgi:hypothetical protein